MNNGTIRARRWPLFVVAIFAAFALTGCVHLDLDASVSSDNKVSGTIAFGLDKELLSAFPGGEEEFLAGLKEDGGCDLPGAKQEPYDEGGYTGVKCTFSDVPLADFNGMSDGETDSLTLNREGDKFVLEGSFDLSEDSGFDPSEPPTPGEPDFADAFKEAEVVFKFTFPGKIESTTGTKSNNDRTATFTADDQGKASIEAVASANSSEGKSVSSPVIWIVIGIAVAIVLLLLLFFFLIRKRRPPNAGGPPQGGYPPPGGYQPGGYQGPSPGYQVPPPGYQGYQQDPGYQQQHPQGGYPYPPQGGFAPPGYQPPSQ